MMNRIAASLMIVLPMVVVGCVSPDSRAPGIAATADSPAADAGTPLLGAAARASQRSDISGSHGDVSPDDTLYADIGGEAGVAALTELFIREIAVDDRISHRYAESDIGRFHRMMQEQMCEVTGGGCRYSGDDMRRTHGGMNITPVEFNGIVEALMRAMDKQGLPVTTQNKLLAIYAPMRSDIIDR